MTTHTTIPASQPLYRTLMANALFSVISGSVLLFAGPWLEDPLGPPAWSIALVGAGVLVFGVGLATGARRRLEATGRFALLADIGWVVATIALAPIVAGHLTGLGRWAAVGIALIVADFALAEWVGLRKLDAGKTRGADRG